MSLATGAGGVTASNSVTVSISVGAPVFVVQPKSSSAEVGETVTLTAEVTNAETYQVTNAETYQWQYRRGTNSWAKLTETAAFVGVTTPTLQITQSETRSQNTYRLVATGAGGVTASDEVTISLCIIRNDVEYMPITSTTCAVVSYSGAATNLVIPQTVEGMTVKEIGAEAFMNNTNLVSIDLPDTITAIRARACV